MCCFYQLRYIPQIPYPQWGPPRISLHTIQAGYLGGNSPAGVNYLLPASNCPQRPTPHASNTQRVRFRQAVSLKPPSSNLTHQTKPASRSLPAKRHNMGMCDHLLLLPLYTTSLGPSGECFGVGESVMNMKIGPADNLLIKVSISTWDNMEKECGMGSQENLSNSDAVTLTIL